jgi:hypothetical protein
MKRNTEGQKFHVVAFNNSGRVSGQAANITCTLSKDGGDRVATNDANPTEIGTTGEYVFELTQAETNAHALSFAPVCNTEGVQLLGMPSNVIYTSDSDAIADAVIDGLGSFSITRIGPEYDPATRTITLISGDDYLASNSSSVVFAITVPGVDLATVTAVFSAAGNNLPVLNGTATLIDLNTTPKLRLEWTRAQTKARKPGRYSWGVALVDANDKVKSILKGPLVLQDNVVADAVVDAAIGGS